MRYAPLKATRSVHHLPLGYRLLTGFFHAWIVLAVLVNCLAIGMQLYLHPFWSAVSTLLDWYSPWNLWNVIAEVLLLSPALGAYWLRERWYHSI